MSRSVPLRRVGVALSLLAGSVAMVWGYVSSWLRGLPRHQDAEFRAFLRRYQRQALFRGKAHTIRALEAERASVWHHNHQASL